MIRALTLSLLVLAVSFCNAQIHHTLLVNPVNIADNDTVLIEGRIQLPNGCVPIDSTFTVIGNNIEFSVCYLYGWTNSTLLSHDTMLYRVGPLPDGIYNVRYIIHATENAQYKHCEQFDRIDSTIISFMVGSSAIHDIDDEPSWQLYPNPTTNQLTIQTKNTFDGNYQITTTTGQLVKQNAITQQPNLTIDVSTLPAGLYFLQLSDGRQRVAKKFVKE